MNSPVVFLFISIRKNKLIVLESVIENPIILIEKQNHERKIRSRNNWRNNRFWDNFFDNYSNQMAI